MVIRVFKTVRGWRCMCGRDGLHIWTGHNGRARLSSHLPPWETDPHNFCVYSHQEVDDGDETPLLVHEGTRTSETEEAWYLGGRRDEETLVNEKDYKTPRLPMGILGAHFESQARHDRLNGHNKKGGA